MLWRRKQGQNGLAAPPRLPQQSVFYSHGLLEREVWRLQSSGFSLRHGAPSAAPQAARAGRPSPTWSCGPGDTQGTGDTHGTGAGAPAVPGGGCGAAPCPGGGFAADSLAQSEERAEFGAFRRRSPKIAEAASDAHARCRGGAR